jgi:hypothetical protein
VAREKLLELFGGSWRAKANLGRRGHRRSCSVKKTQKCRHRACTLQPSLPAHLPRCSASALHAVTPRTRPHADSPPKSWAAPSIASPRRRLRHELATWMQCVETQTYTIPCAQRRSLRNDDPALDTNYRRCKSSRPSIGMNI